MNTSRMPVLFVGHGSPMNAIEENEYSLAWKKLGKSLTRPKAIVCVSAHWETDGPQVTAMDRPRTIHDFGGFPRELYEKQYPAPGDPALAETIKAAVKHIPIKSDLNWGLDHGTWSVLTCMYPQADIPVVQLSLDHTRSGEFHYNLGRALGFLRDRGVLVIGSGNIVHNLMMVSWGGYPYDWAQEFDEKAGLWIREGNHTPLIHYETLGKGAALAINSGEHYLPLLYILGMQEPGEPVEFLNESIMAGSLSMRCVLIGSSTAD